MRNMRKVRCLARSRWRSLSCILFFLLALMLAGLHQGTANQASAFPTVSSIPSTIVSPPFMASQFSPADGETGVSTKAKVSVSFNRDLDLSTVRPESFYLEEQGGDPVSAQVGWKSPRMATLDPGLLSPGTTYVATLTDAIKSNQGETLIGAPISWSFTVDTAPSVVSQLPEDGATDIPVDVVISIAFDKDMAPDQWSSLNLYIEESGTTDKLPATYFYDAGARTTTLDPAANLEGGTTYQVTLTVGWSESCIELADTPIVWSFTTVVQAPEVITKLPEDGATDVPCDWTVTVTFDQEMDASSITSDTFWIQEPGGEPLPAVVTYYPYDGATATLDPVAELEAGTTYQVTLSEGIMSLFGQVLVGTPHLWSFTTEAEGPTAPVFTDVIPGETPYAEAIAALAGRGIIDGYADGRFGPGDPVTRQQFAKMIVLAADYPVSTSDTCPFGDVALQMGTDPLYPSCYVAVAANHGITVGKTAITFDPYSNITRYQVISMVVRAADDLQPGQLGAPPLAWTGTAGWGADPTHGANTLRAEYHGLLSGLPLASLEPHGNMTRGEVAQVLHNLILVMGLV